MRAILIVLAACLAAGFTPAADADTAAVGAVFSDTEIAVIRSFYRDHQPSAAAGGGRKHKRLPPGIAKNLRAGKPLPPGIAKRGLPAGLLDRLPPAPRGYERIEIDGRILLVEIATQIIHDVITDLVFR